LTEVIEINGTFSVVLTILATKRFVQQCVPHDHRATRILAYRFKCFYIEFKKEHGINPTLKRIENKHRTRLVVELNSWYINKNNIFDNIDIHGPLKRHRD